MVSRLISVCILPYHACAEDGQLALVRRLEREHAVQFLRKAFLSAGQGYQSVDIVLYRPEILPSVAFTDVRRIVFRLEIFDELSGFVFGLHECRGRTVHVPVILRAGVKLFRYIFFPHFVCHDGNAIIVESVFQGLGERPVVPSGGIVQIEGNIPILLVEADAPVVVQIGRRHTCGQGFFSIKIAYTFQVSVGNHGYGMIAYHHVCFASVEIPYGQSSVLLGKSQQRFDHVVHPFRLCQCEERVCGPVGVPQREGAVMGPAVGLMVFPVGSVILPVHIVINGRCQHAVV